MGLGQVESLRTAPVPLIESPPDHAASFRTRRFLNWFPMGLTYAFLYMGRYNLNVAKNALGDLMTKEDFGAIFGFGTAAYFLSILVNGVLVDRMGGRRGILLAAGGSGLMNLLLGLYLSRTVNAGTVDPASLKLWFTVLYAGNMYFQSAGAVSIVKVNSAWFHVRERGGFSGIFGTMIASGVFFAYTVNGWILDFFSGEGSGVTKVLAARWVFFAPAALLGVMAVVELFLLADRPSDAGQRDFDTGDASSGETSQVSTWQLVRRILSNPVILTIGCVEFCTGVLRNGVMQWFPIYVKEVLTLPPSHPLHNGSWTFASVLPFLGGAAVLGFLASRLRGARRGIAIASAGLVFVLPFLQAGWGGILMVAGIVGGNTAGWVSDLFFRSRRAPAAGGMYALLFVTTLAMIAVLGTATNVVSTSKVAELHPGDRVVAVAEQRDLSDWAAVKRAFACVPVACAGGAAWDTTRCLCSRSVSSPATEIARGSIDLTVERDGGQVVVSIPDPAVRRGEGGALLPRLRAGDGRDLAAAPVLSLSPYWLGVVVFLMSLAVIGTHGLLSGTATMDFGGRRGAATSVALIDGFVYAGTTVQAFALGYLTTRSWTYWPLFLAPFAGIGFLLCTRIWSAAPRGPAAH